MKAAPSPPFTTKVYTQMWDHSAWGELPVAPQSLILS